MLILSFRDLDFYMMIISFLNKTDLGKGSLKKNWEFFTPKTKKKLPKCVLGHLESITEKNPQKLELSGTFLPQES